MADASIDKGARAEWSMVNVVKVLGIVGSPHKDGRTNKFLPRAQE